MGDIPTDLPPEPCGNGPKEGPRQYGAAQTSQFLSPC